MYLTFREKQLGGPFDFTENEKGAREALRTLSLGKRPKVGQLGPYVGGDTFFSKDGTLLLTKAMDHDCDEFDETELSPLYKDVPFSTYSGDKKEVVTFVGSANYVSVVACVLLS